MRHLTHKDILEMEKIYRLNLINSCTGYKSANLIATADKQGVTNVAIFSSITHLGSNPPLLGFILRPTTVPRNTYHNLKETSVFTVNHVNYDIIKDAHHTSAKYDGAISEFDKTDLNPDFKDGFHAPYVEQAQIQIGCQFINEYHIEENGCLLILGQIEHLYYDQAIQHEDGFLQLDKAGTVTVNGLDGYALPELRQRFEYARPLE